MVQSYGQMLDEVANALERLNDDVDKYAGLVTLVEWSGANATCPWCHASRDLGHWEACNAFTTFGGLR